MSFIRCRVDIDTPGRSRNARETVDAATPARSATSSILTLTRHNDRADPRVTQALALSEGRMDESGRVRRAGGRLRWLSHRVLPGDGLRRRICRKSPGGPS